MIQFNLSLFGRKCFPYFLVFGMEKALWWKRFSLSKGWKIFLERRLEQLDPVLYVPVPLPLRGYTVAKNGNRER